MIASNCSWFRLLVPYVNCILFSRLSCSSVANIDTYFSSVVHFLFVPCRRFHVFRSKLVCFPFFNFPLSLYLHNLWRNLNWQWPASFATLQIGFSPWRSLKILSLFSFQFLLLKLCLFLISQVAIIKCRFIWIFLFVLVLFQKSKFKADSMISSSTWDKKIDLYKYISNLTLSSWI